MNKRLHSELVALFGRRLVDMAKALDVTSLELTAERMGAVEAATEALLAHNGDTERQRAVVTGLDTYTALLLCMWVMDTDMFTNLVPEAA